jgi:transglutaminase-like putative cysteine protease
MTGVQASPARNWAARSIDIAVVLVLGALALVPLASTFADPRYWLAALGGVGVGVAVAVIGTLLGGGLLEVTAMSALAYFLLGGLFALRESAILGFLPSLVTLRDLALSVVTGWKQLLTVSTPVNGFEQLFAVPYLAGLVAAVVAASLALRARRPGWAMLPVSALLVFAIAFGADDALLPAVTGAVLAAVALGWTAWRRHAARAASAGNLVAGDVDETRRANVRQFVLGGLSLIVAGAVGAVSVGVWSGGWDRLTLREQVVPPLELYQYPTPLMSFRKMVEDGTDNTLFTVSGLPTGSRIRIATLDSYDGIVYKVSGSGGAGSGVFTRVGRVISGDAAGDAATMRVQIKSLRGVWLPDAGYPTEAEFGGARAGTLASALQYNKATGTAVDTAGVADGDSYTLRTVIAKTPTDEQLAQATVAQISTPAPEMMPDAVQNLVDEAVAGAATPIQKVLAVQKYLLDKGYLSHGLDTDKVPSRPGHSYERISSMLETQQLVGDDEQYSVLMALMLAQAGLPARVVMGFEPAIADSAADTPVTGADVRAWVEVPLDGLGWVALDATPDKKPQQMTQEQRQKPRVQVPQPPLPPQQPADLPPQPPAADQSEDPVIQDYSWIWRIVTVGGVSLGVLAVIFGPGLAMLWLKARRRARRRTADSLPDRVSGAWAEVVDAATDVGVTVPATATRREHAVALAERYPDLELGGLAARADVAVFAAGEPAPAEVDAYWDDVAQARRGIARHSRLVQRVRRFFWPRSLIGVRHR